MSALMPVVLMALMWRLNSPEWGLLAGVVLLHSLLLHEFAHAVVARLLGGDVQDIIIWPLGGLGTAEPGYRRNSAFWIAMAGPAANLLGALCCAYPLYRGGHLAPLLNPLNAFSIEASHSLYETLLRLAFVINWGLLLVNLLPVEPLDGGHILRWFLNLRLSEQETEDLMLRLGLVTGILGLLCGFMFDQSGVAALSAFILILHIHETIPRHSVSVPRRDSFMGYDFSAGYTSLDRSGSELADKDPDVAGDEYSETGILDRWRIRREDEQMRREQEQSEREEAELDAILQKLHQQGRSALTTSEMRLLDQVSERLRQRNART